MLGHVCVIIHGILCSHTQPYTRHKQVVLVSCINLRSGVSLSLWGHPDILSPRKIEKEKKNFVSGVKKVFHRFFSLSAHAVRRDNFSQLIIPSSVHTQLHSLLLGKGVQWKLTFTYPSFPIRN